MKMMRCKTLFGMGLSLLVAMFFVSCGGTQTASKGGSAMPETSTALGSSDLSSAPVTTESGTLKPASSAAVSSGKTTPAKTSASSTKSTAVISTNTEAPPVSKPFSTYLLTERESIQNGETLAIVAERKMDRLFDEDYSNNKLILVCMSNAAELDTFINTLKECNEDISPYDSEYLEARYQRYGTQYFQQNTLMALFFPYSSSSITAEVTSFVRHKDEICIEWIMKSPEGGVVSDDVDFRFAVIEVKTSDISGVKTWGYHMEGQTY